MTRSSIYHALGLHMHQPPGNLRLLIESNAWEAEQIIRAYERPVRYALQYRDVAHLHIGFSGVLLEQLLDPGIVDSYRHILDIPEMLARYAEADNIELIGMGYYHPIFPLIPRADWEEQLDRGLSITERAFGRAPRGFWPPEMAFSMEMVPALVQAGYEYVVVDGVHVRPEDGISDVFRPYLACHEGVCINIIPRDRDVSNAQESGLDPNWFQKEVRWRVEGSARPHETRLVTTWSDGENGGWFRQTHEGSGFFGHFFAPYMEHFREDDYPISPVSLSDFLRHTPAEARAQVQTGAWNIGGNSGLDLSQWAGSESQRSAVGAVSRLSARYWDLRRRADGSTASVDTVSARMERARQLILEAETSCFLFWGDAWIPHLYERTSQAGQGLDAVEAALSALGAETGSLLEPAHPPVDPVPATAHRPAQASGARSGGRGRGGATKASKQASPKTREHKAASLRPGTARTTAPRPKPVRHTGPRRGPGAAAGPGRRGVKRGPRG